MPGLVPSLAKLSTSRLAPVGANPPSPKQSNATPTTATGLQTLPIELFEKIVLDVVAANPADACVKVAQLCAMLQKEIRCDNALYGRAMQVLKMPPDTLLDTSSWKARFDGVCREDAALRAADGWMRRGILTASLDWEDKKFQLHTAVSRLEAFGPDAYPHLAWLMRARGGDPSFARAPVPDGTKLRDFPELSAENNYTHTEYGPIAEWDVADVTDMRLVFMDATSFNGDISKWDVSNVTNMFGMFMDATSFSGDISKWDVSNVTHMNGMFWGATGFNGNLSGWDVSNVINMARMFWSATSFNGDISKWDVSNVADMAYMFAGATSFIRDISKWIVSKVAHMDDMFAGATSFNGDLSEWDVSNVRTMTGMFDNATRFHVANHASWYMKYVRLYVHGDEA